MHFEHFPTYMVSVVYFDMHYKILSVTLWDFNSSHKNHGNSYSNTILSNIISNVNRNRGVISRAIAVCSSHPMQHQQEQQPQRHQRQQQ